MLNDNLLRQIFSSETVLDDKQSYILFGADIKGSLLYKLLRNHNFDIKFFVDNDINKQIKGFMENGAKVFSPLKLIEEPLSKIILTLSPLYLNVIYKQLFELGIHRDRIIVPKNCDFAPFGEREDVLNKLEINKERISFVISLLADEHSKNVLRGIVKYCTTLDLSELSKIYDNRYPQYFDEELISLHDNEVFVDGGCLNFDTSFLFIKRVRDYKKIYAFEPEHNNFLKIKEATKHLDSSKIKLFNKGIYSEKKLHCLMALDYIVLK